MVRIAPPCTDSSIAVFWELNQREVRNLLRIGRGAGKVFLKQHLTALPGSWYLGHQLLQPVPFPLKAPALVGGLHRASEKGFAVVWIQCLLLIRTSSTVPPSNDQAMDVLDRQGCRKPFWTDLCPAQIKAVFSIITPRARSCAFMDALPPFVVKHAVIVLLRRGPAAVNDRALPPTAPGRQTHAVICCDIQQRYLATAYAHLGSSSSPLCSMLPHQGKCG